LPLPVRAMDTTSLLGKLFNLSCKYQKTIVFQFEFHFMQIIKKVIRYKYTPFAFLLPLQMKDPTIIRGLIM
jgi:hypothetical protein